MIRAGRWSVLVLAIACPLVVASVPACGDDSEPVSSDSDSDGDSDSDSDSDSDTDTDVDTDTDTDTDIDTDSDTETDTDTGTGEEPDTDTWDCDALPSAPLSMVNLVGALGYHDVAFTNDGYIVGSDGMNLIKADVEGTATVFAMGVSGVQGMDTLPDGDIVAASGSNGLVRLTPEGVMTTLAPSLWSLYGVTVGPDGMVYCGDNTNLYRVDPTSGAIETIATGISARGVDFSPATEYGLRMYITSFDGYGHIYVADLDTEMNIIGYPMLFATIPGGGSYLDGIAVDDCGNVFVPNYNTSALYRISPMGLVATFHDWASTTNYGHGVKWGSGIGGWDDTCLYMPMPYNMNKVVKLDVGVHHADY